MSCKLKYYRIQKGYKLEYLAKVTNLSESYLSRLENGLKTNPSLKAMNKIASVLEESISDIFGE